MKNFISINIKILVVIFVFAQLSGCGMERVSADSSAAPNASQETDRLQAANAETTLANDQKLDNKKHLRVKPGAAVSLSNQEPLFASIPGTYEYQLQLVSSHRSGNMTVSVSTSDGIEVVSKQTRFEFELHDGGNYVLPLTVSAPRNGRFYIQLQVSITADGQTSARSVAAILQVGDPVVTKQKASLKSSADKADGVIVLPAQETISPR